MFKRKIWNNPNILLHISIRNQRSQLPRGFWKDKNNQKEFLLDVQKRRGLASPSEWYKIKRIDFQKEGGIGMMKHYSSLYDIVKEHFPEYSWNPLKFTWKPHGFWDSHDNQKLLFDSIARKYNIQNQSDWKKIGYPLIQKEFGGRTLMRRFPSVFAALSAIYPEKSWNIKEVRQNYSPRHWESVENQRARLDEVRVEKGIEHLSDWKNVSSSEFCKLEGCASILSKYSSYYDMLRTIYPEYEWNVFDDLPRVSRNYWKSTENQKEFMKSLAKSLGIKDRTEWLKITTEDIKNAGGQQLLNIYGSIFSILQNLFPELKLHEIHDFSSSRIPTHYFDCEKNQRHFMDGIGKRLGLTKISDWNDVSRNQIQQAGGGSLLARYSSILKLLQATYPEYKWKGSDRKIVPRAFWKDEKNQREFFDNLKTKYKIQKVEDWKNISYNQIVKEGGGRILRCYSSLYDALKSIYPEISWNAIQVRTRVPNRYWDDKNNVRELLEAIAKKYNVENDEDWERISIEQIQNEGGRSIFVKYGSLYNILKLAYPEKKWDKSKLKNRNKRAVQRWMCILVREIFSGHEVIEEFLHEEMSRKSGRSIELDAFIPSLKIGFEYQGKHHYEECPSLGSLDLYKQRDEEKLKLCKESKISLVIVPYWWDTTKDSLQDLIDLDPKDSS